MRDSHATLRQHLEAIRDNATSALTIINDSPRMHALGDDGSDLGSTHARIVQDPGYAATPAQGEMYPNDDIGPGMPSSRIDLGPMNPSD